MRKTISLLLSIYFALSGCTPTQQPTPTPTAGPTSTPIPAAVLPTRTSLPAPTATATQTIKSDLFLKISRFGDTLHLKCNPREIIFDVTIKDERVQDVLFYFRMRDKASGMVNGWSSKRMVPAGNYMYEYILRAVDIPDDGRYQQAWVQYQFVGVDQTGESLGNTQIFSDAVHFTRNCP